MNLPNKLTVLRVFLIPVFVAFYFAQSIPHNYFWALLVFGTASITDIFDGMIARRRGLLTDFGALMDPLADKLLVMSAMVCFVYTGVVHGAVVVVLLSREFMVTSIRLVGASKGKVISADRWGKLKTAMQMTWICIGLLGLWLVSLISICIYGGNFDVLTDSVILALRIFNALFDILTWVVVAVTALSGLNYLRKNRQLFADG